MSAVAWGLFAKVEDGEWNLQHPVRFSHDDAAADRAMYERGTLIEIRPLYDTDPMAAYAEGRKDEREVWGPVLEALKTLRVRLLECSEHGSISARDAYDSFYQAVVDDAIKAVTGEQA